VSAAHHKETIMKSRIHLPALAAMATAAVLLAACGGSDDEPAPAAEDPTVVPASVSGSVAAWFNFAKALVASDTSEALAMTNINTLPTTETDEPTSLGQ
jgi:hypothetical protein